MPPRRAAIEQGDLTATYGAWSSIPVEWIANRKINLVVKFASGPLAAVPASISFASDLISSSREP
jgi:hypothetical protein